MQSKIQYNFIQNEKDEMNVSENSEIYKFDKYSSNNSLMDK